MMTIVRSNALYSYAHHDARFRVKSVANIVDSERFRSSFCMYVCMYESTRFPLCSVRRSTNLGKESVANKPRIEKLSEIQTISRRDIRS
jgi:hypothetical protein